MGDISPSSVSSAPELQSHDAPNPSNPIVTLSYAQPVTMTGLMLPYTTFPAQISQQAPLIPNQTDTSQDHDPPHRPPRSTPYHMSSVVNNNNNNNNNNNGWTRTNMRGGPSQGAVGSSSGPSRLLSNMPQYGAAVQGGYYLPQHAQMTPYYHTAHMSTPQAPSHMPMSQRMTTGCYSNPVAMNQHSHSHQAYYYPPNPYVGPNPMLSSPVYPGSYMGPPSGGPQLDLKLRHSHREPFGYYRPMLSRGIASADPGLGIVRGPPRKPRQSGHAIWIGNLPPQTDLMSLVYHVCKEASGLESLFLISKSNCAFANFKDEQSCVAAQRALSDSRFQSVRLVSRLRRNTVEGASGIAAPTGPSVTAQSTATAAAHEEQSTQKKPASSVASPQEATTMTAMHGPVSSATATSNNPSESHTERYFILKSLTVEDLELSVRKGIWATQAHNEGALNNAFRTAEKVYLIFSANKSGEYFGFARMMSTISDDAAAAIELAPSAPTTLQPDLPRSVPTEATEFAPKGCIIDDSARGTIFWEAKSDEADEQARPKLGDAGGGFSASAKKDQISGELRGWGRPFQLQWICTARLPFFRTRGLRNMWNANREVKIARDGTEVEPTVGRRLISLFPRQNNHAQRNGYGPGYGYVGGNSGGNGGGGGESVSVPSGPPNASHRTIGSMPPVNGPRKGDMPQVIASFPPPLGRGSYPP